MVWFGPVRSVSGLARSVAALDLSPAAREENETDRKSAQQRPVGSMQGRKAKRSEAQLGLFLKMPWTGIYLYEGP